MALDVQRKPGSALWPALMITPGDLAANLHPDPVTTRMPIAHVARLGPAFPVHDPPARLEQADEVFRVRHGVKVRQMHAGADRKPQHQEEILVQVEIVLIEVIAPGGIAGGRHHHLDVPRTFGALKLDLIAALGRFAQCLTGLVQLLQLEALADHGLTATDAQRHVAEACQ